MTKPADSTVPRFDAVICGAGIAGVSLAWRLAPRWRVLLIEREAQPGTHATGRSAAMFMPSYGPPGVRALTRASRAFYSAPPAGFAAQPLLAPRPVLYVAPASGLAELQALHATLQAEGQAVLRLDAAQAAARVPCLRPEALAAALLESDAHEIDVDALLQGFLRGVRAHGGELRCRAELLQAERAGAAGDWRLSLADGRVVRTPLLVNAAGAWADELARRCGVAPLGLQPHRRSAFTFRPPPELAVARWPLVDALGDAPFYFKPDAGALLASPANADPVPPHDVVAEELDIAIAIDRIQALTTLRIARPTHTWAGLRSFVADGELVIGPDPRVAGFFWLAGQGGYGIQSAPAASALAAALLLGQAGPHGVDAALFSPARPALARALTPSPAPGSPP